MTERPSSFPTAAHHLRGGMVGMGMIFDETYRPFFESAYQSGVYDPRFGILDIELAAVASRTGSRAQRYLESSEGRVSRLLSFVEPDSMK